MNPDSIDALLSQSVPISGCGLLALAVLVVVVIPFVLGRTPQKPDPEEHPLQQAYTHSGNALWWLIFLACAVVALALAGEAVGIDTMRTLTPR